MFKWDPTSNGLVVLFSLKDDSDICKVNDTLMIYVRNIDALNIDVYQPGIICFFFFKVIFFSEKNLS